MDIKLLCIERFSYIKFYFLDFFKTIFYIFNYIWKNVDLLEKVRKLQLYRRNSDNFYLR